MPQSLAWTQTGCRRFIPRRLLHRSTSSLFFVLAVTVLQAILPATVNAASVERPNIVLIMVDDMGFSDIGCYGGEIRTPNVDRLAAQGLRFKQFYNNAKCTTTRASLITGLYPRPRGGLLKTNMVTIAEVLKSAGYHTALTGKWHLGSSAPRRPIDRGFDRFYGLLDGCCNFFDPTIPDPKFKGGRVRVFAENKERITEFPDDFYTTDAFSDHAVRFVRDVADSDKPFFLHVCYTAPHYPLHALPEDIARYKGKYLRGWDALRKQRHKRQIEMGLIDPRWQAPARDPEAEAWSEAQNKDWQDLRMAVYAAMIDRMDQGVGRILAQLEDSGVAKNTLVMFLSDNGGCAETPGGNDPNRIPGPKDYYTHCGPGWAYAQNTPFRRYKQWVHEGGISTPFVVRWPGRVRANTLCNDVAHIIDLLPTCADVARAKYPEIHNGNEILPLDGLSMTPIFEGKDRDGHKSLCWAWAGSRAVRIGNMKLCWDRTIRKWELYDVLADRTETDDLAAERPEVVRSMSETWLAWAQDTGVNVKTRNSKKQKTKKKN